MESPGVGEDYRLENMRTSNRARARLATTRNGERGRDVPPRRDPIEETPAVLKGTALWDT